jgi:Protein of unknown function (DUF3099)
MHVARRPAKTPVYRITAARVPLSEDVAGRQRRYVIQMSIRAVCFLLAVLVPGFMRYVFLLAAIVLPYVAVVGANAGRGNLQAGADALLNEPMHDQPRALGQGPAEPPAP